MYNSTSMPEHNPRAKWIVLTLAVLTNMVVMAIPAMGMSVLAKEISTSLGLNLVQVGVIWGIGSLPMIVTALIGGAVGDKLGPKRILVAGCLLLGGLGAARGLAGSFAVLVALVLLLGAFAPFLSMNTMKVARQWFPTRQLGLANGALSMGMALGFMLGALLSATVLSPLLGGWRNVLIFYGLCGALFSLPWLLVPPPPRPDSTAAEPSTTSMKASIAAVTRLKNVWLLGITLLGFGGCVQGLLGYLPLYLRSAGWQPPLADGALTLFHTVSLIFALPIALWSDRLGSRKSVLAAAILAISLGTGLLSFVRGGGVWAAVVLAGFARDAAMAVFFTMVMEVKGVGQAYGGTATGLTMALSGIGSAVAPPLGNSLAAWFPGAPFAFWAAWALLGFLCLTQVKEDRRSR
jgi:MFS transporter, CP family, cyanate transporter